MNQGILMLDEYKPSMAAKGIAYSYTPAALKALVTKSQGGKFGARAVSYTHLDLSGRRRPASFIFVGPTGVGKTELVKQLANQLFDGPDPLIDVYKRQL